jgi:hypothetical protein
MFKNMGFVIKEDTIIQSVICQNLRFYELLVGCPCVATAHNNTHVNYPPKRSQDFLLIASALRIIFFYLTN